MIQYTSLQLLKPSVKRKDEDEGKLDVELEEGLKLKSYVDIYISDGSSSAFTSPDGVEEDP